MKIIEITGAMHSGKDYFAQALVDEMVHQGKSVWKTSFAWKLKDLVSRHFKVDKRGFIPGFDPTNVSRQSYIGSASDFSDDVDEIYAEIHGETSFTHRGIPMQEFSAVFSTLDRMLSGELSGPDGGRIILQNVGTEVVRNNVCPSFWVDFVATAAKKISSALDFVVISDMRFNNEEIPGAYKIRISTSDDVRSQRSGVSLEKLREFSKHPSESGIMEIPVYLEIDNDKDGLAFRSDIKMICEMK